MLIIWMIFLCGYILLDDYIMELWFILLIILVIIIIYKKYTIEGFDNGEGVLMKPIYNNGGEIIKEYSDKVIDEQNNEIQRLRKQLFKLADIVTEGPEEETPKFYRKKLSNTYYKVAPYVSGSNDYLTLEDDDFSTKTLSTIKFLSQTQPSKFWGNEVNFPDELCDNFCETDDKNAKYNEQIDLVRPINQTGYVNLQK
jgi:hypothetical protein